MYIMTNTKLVAIIYDKLILFVQGIPNELKIQ